ncbi:hypothetical protein OKA05_09395 [Luteolibacter arcticus]|uniref:Uncharacterized protein n=1 Tax=Luteolibacter arcticus TaxID=1581411 RepID=A0ABT3GHP7_9BACT|nr:hypothetical protein [Luteolibacter arcticus]MCW1922764.1 hypothetical protein [Luteolibacter arcticus]
MKRRAMLQGLMVAGIAVAFAAGHKVARRSAGARDRDGGSPSHPTAGFEAGFRGSLTRDVAGARSWQEAKEKVRERWEASPAPRVDYELRDDTLRLLEKAPVADLEAWLRELKSLDQTDYDRDVPLLLRQMVLKILARRSGSSLIRSLVGNPTEEGEGDVDDAMDHWLEHDPVAALDWLDGEVPEVIAEYLDSYREKALVALAESDPAEFERRLAKVDAEIRENVLESYARREGVPEGRADLLARAADSPHGEAMALWKGLLRREGDDDPMRAYSTLSELKVSPDDRAALDQALVSWLLITTGQRDGGEVMQAWVERNPGDQVPEGMLESFDDWSEFYSDDAQAWVAEQPAGPRFDVFAGVLIERGLGIHESADGMIARLSDTTLRAAMLRRLKESWEKKDAAAAAEWERGLPEEERERLKEAEVKRVSPSDKPAPKSDFTERELE